MGRAIFAAYGSCGSSLTDCSTVFLSECYNRLVTIFGLCCTSPMQVLPKVLQHIAMAVKITVPKIITITSTIKITITREVKGRESAAANICLFLGIKAAE